MKPFLPTVALGALLTTLAGSSHGPEADPLERGKYLMDSIVACSNCHLQQGAQGEPLFDKGLSGGMVFDEPPFKAYAPNITPDPATGIGKSDRRPAGQSHPRRRAAGQIHHRPADADRVLPAPVRR